MPDPGKYDLNFRPNSYWEPEEEATLVGARIKGELRRKVALQGLAAGVADGRSLKSALDEDERVAAGRVHPWLMGGEYLPDIYPNEVEIARVVLTSVTMDVTSIRARHTKHCIVYRIVDEYCDREYSLKPKTSKRPLKMSKVIHLVESNNLIDEPRESNYENGYQGSPEEIYAFATASSEYYPELSHWFDEENEEWLEREEAKIAQLEDEA